MWAVYIYLGLVAACAVTGWVFALISNHYTGRNR